MAVPLPGRPLAGVGEVPRLFQNRYKSAVREEGGPWCLVSGDAVAQGVRRYVLASLVKCHIKGLPCLVGGL